MTERVKKIRYRRTISDRRMIKDSLGIVLSEGFLHASEQ